MNKYTVYLKAFQNVIYKRLENEADRTLLKRNVFYGVQLINAMKSPSDYDQARSDFELASIVKQVASELTPKEFINIFPIDKYYHGEKNGDKDYFYTMNYIESLNLNEPIGDGVLTFLMEYANNEILHFNVQIMCFMSAIRRYEGKPSIAKEWADMNGVDTYSKHTDNKGKEFLIDQEGRTQKVQKKRHLYAVT